MVYVEARVSLVQVMMTFLNAYEEEPDETCPCHLFQTTNHAAALHPILPAPLLLPTLLKHQRSYCFPQRSGVWKFHQQPMVTRVCLSSVAALSWVCYLSCLALGRVHRPKTQQHSEVAALSLVHFCHKHSWRNSQRHS